MERECAYYDFYEERFVVKLQQSCNRVSPSQHSSTAIVNGQSFQQWFVNSYMFNNVGQSPLVSGFFWGKREYPAVVVDGHVLDYRVYILVRHYILPRV